jgi:hypothetical protein
MIRRYLVALEADDEHAVIRLLRVLLKRLGRDHGVRCRSIAPVASQEGE